jgi:hypothetical protein
LFESVYRYSAAVLKFEQQQINTPYDVTQIATESEISNAGALALEQFLFCH